MQEGRKGREEGRSNVPFVSTLNTPPVRETRRASRDGSVRDARLENLRVIPIVGSVPACFPTSEAGEEG